MPEVLIVDDDPNNRLLLATILKHAGHTPLEASTGAAGMLVAQEHVPALAIVDLALPDVSGAQLVRRLRANPRTASLKIALYTATHSPEAIEELTEIYSIDAVIPKPGDPREILRILEKLLPP